MAGLFYKEIIQIVSNKVTHIAMIAFLILIISSVVDNYILNMLPMVAFIVSIFTLNTQYEDEKNSFENFALASPVTYKEFLLPKYIIIWIASLFVFSLSMIILNFFSEQPILQIVTTSFLVLFIQTLFPCFLLPLSYKFGSQKARIVFLLIFFATIFLLIPALKNFVLKSEALTAYILNTEKNFYSLKYILIISIAIILINAISFFSSALIIKNKEY